MRKIIFLALLAALVLSSCRSSRHARKEGKDAVEVVTPKDPTTASSTSATTTNTGTKNQGTDKNNQASATSTKTSKKQTRNTKVTALTAKMDLKLSAGSKSVKVGGTYRLKHDDVVQINLVYNLAFIPINVGTLELTKDSILVLDRMNKRYCRVAYGEVPDLKKGGIDFEYLQRVFWGDDVASNAYVQCQYGDWKNLSNGKFPEHITFTLKSSTSGKYKADFELNSIQETSKWETRTKVPAKYTKVSLNTVMNAIMSVAK